MSGESDYCLKTGGLVYIEQMEAYYESDLHVYRSNIIAITAGKAQYGLEKDTDELLRLTLWIKRGTPFFHRDWNPYGLIVVAQQYCEIPLGMIRHIQEWYSSKALNFRNYRQGGA